ncbi:MAG: hypothetical protein Q8N76_08265 [Candidatus Omnitrophota bacterium]|nr:hypothetical protein [Candidatus Omnitrophota bacterium]
MRKIKKVYSFKIISVPVLMVFIFTSTGYSTDLSCKETYLRTVIMTSDKNGEDRLHATYTSLASGETTRRKILKLGGVALGASALYFADKYKVIQWANYAIKFNTTRFMTLEEKLNSVKKLTKTIQGHEEALSYASRGEIDNVLQLRNQLVDEIISLGNPKASERLVETLSLKEAEKEVFKETGLIIEGARKYREVAYIADFLKALPVGQLKGLRSVLITRIGADSSLKEAGKIAGFHYFGSSFLVVVPFGYKRNSGYIFGDHLNHEFRHFLQPQRTKDEIKAWRKLYNASTEKSGFVSKYAHKSPVEDDAEVYRDWTLDSRNALLKARSPGDEILQKKTIEMLMSPRDGVPLLRFNKGKAYLYIFKANRSAEIEINISNGSEIRKDLAHSFESIYNAVSQYEFKGFEFDLIKVTPERAYALIMEQYGQKKTGILHLSEKLENFFAQLMQIDYSRALDIIRRIPPSSISDRDIKSYFNLRTPVLRQVIETVVMSERILSVFGVQADAQPLQIVKGIEEMKIGTVYEENSRDFYYPETTIVVSELTHGTEITDGLGIVLASIISKDIEKSNQIRLILKHRYKVELKSLSPWSLGSPFATFIKLYPTDAIRIIKERNDLTKEFIYSEGVSAILGIIELDSRLAVEVIENIEQSGEKYLSLNAEAFRLMSLSSFIDSETVRRFWKDAVNIKGEGWLKIRLKGYFKFLKEYGSSGDFINNSLIPSLSKIIENEPILSKIVKEAFREVFGKQFDSLALLKDGIGYGALSGRFRKIYMNI